MPTTKKPRKPTTMDPFYELMYEDYLDKLKELMGEDYFDYSGDFPDYPDDYFDFIYYEGYWGLPNITDYGNYTDYPENSTFILPDIVLEPIIVTDAPLTSFHFAGNNINLITSAIGLLIGVFHIFFLTRKELRSNFVFILMLGIALCDLINVMSTIIQQIVVMPEWTMNMNCPYGRPYSFEFAYWISTASTAMSRSCSALLALFMAAFRALAVMFPLSHAMQVLLQPISAFLITILIILISLFYHGSLHYQYTVRAVDLSYSECEGKEGYYQFYTDDVDYDIGGIYDDIEGFSAVVISFLYLIFTFLLLRKVWSSQRARKSMSSEKSDSTSALVITMALVFFLTECSYGMYFLLGDVFTFNEFPEFSGWYQSFGSFFFTFLTFNSIVHCFICFLMSTQYRETVLKRFGCLKRRHRVNVLQVVSNGSDKLVTVRKTNSNISVVGS